MNNSSNYNNKKFGFGLLLIFIGIVFVASNLGYYNNAVWALPVIFQAIYYLVKHKNLNALFALVIGVCIILKEFGIVKEDILLGALILTAGVVVVFGAFPAKEKIAEDKDHDGYIDDVKPSKNNNRKKNKNTYNEDEFDSYIRKHDNNDEFDSYISK